MKGSNLHDYLGLKRSDALSLALLRGRPVSIVCADGIEVPHPLHDATTSRICLTVVNDIVTAATLG